MRKRYKIILKVDRFWNKPKIVRYYVEHRVLGFLWIRFTETHPVGFADFQTFESTYISTQEAREAILKHYKKTLYYKLTKGRKAPIIEDEVGGYYERTEWTDDTA